MAMHSSDMRENFGAYEQRKADWEIEKGLKRTLATLLAYTIDLEQASSAWFSSRSYAVRPEVPEGMPEAIRLALNLPEKYSRDDLANSRWLKEEAS